MPVFEDASSSSTAPMPAASFVASSVVVPLLAPPPSASATAAAKLLQPRNTFSAPAADSAAGGGKTPQMLQPSAAHAAAALAKTAATVAAASHGPALPVKPEEPPASLICPITNSLMVDPVTASDGRWVIKANGGRVHGQGSPPTASWQTRDSIRWEVGELKLPAERFVCDVRAHWQELADTSLSAWQLPFLLVPAAPHTLVSPGNHLTIRFYKSPKSRFPCRLSHL